MLPASRVKEPPVAAPVYARGERGFAQIRRSAGLHVQATGLLVIRTRQCRGEELSDSAVMLRPAASMIVPPGEPTMRSAAATYAPGDVELRAAVYREIVFAARIDTRPDGNDDGAAGFDIATEQRQRAYRISRGGSVVATAIRRSTGAALELLALSDCAPLFAVRYAAGEIERAPAERNAMPCHRSGSPRPAR